MFSVFAVVIVVGGVGGDGHGGVLLLLLHVFQMLYSCSPNRVENSRIQ